MAKTLSIIVPTYNMEQFLRKGLDSLCVNKHADALEVLVINDGSKDSSLDIAREFERKHPQIFRAIDKPNGNYGSCINRALKEATGKYVKIMDADDWYDTAALEEMLEVMSAVDVDLFISNFVKVTDKGNIDNKFSLKPRTALRIEQVPPVEWIGLLEMHSIAYRREMVLSAAYVQLEGISYTDIQWAAVPMTHVKSLYYFDRGVYHYYFGREGNTMSQLYTEKWLRQVMQVCHKIADAIAEGRDKGLAATGVVESQFHFRLREIYRGTLLKGRINDADLRTFDDYLKLKVPALHASLAEDKAHSLFPYRTVAAWRRNGRVSGLAATVYNALRRLRQSV